MDETYTHISHTSMFCSGESGLFVPVSKDQRLIIMHAGHEDGFVAGALQISLNHWESSQCTELQTI
jgi:hypothetical protein